MNICDKIRVLLIRRKMTLQELAHKIETSPQNLSNKLSRNNFNLRDLSKIAGALACKLDITFELDDTKERI